MEEYMESELSSIFRVKLVTNNIVRGSPGTQFMDMRVKAISRIELTKDLINKFSILNGAKCFSSGIFQNYLVFMPAKKCIKYFSGTTQIDLWKSSGMLEGNIENINKLDSNLAPKFVDHYSLPDINFNGHCLISNISVPKKVTNIYIPYKLNP